MDRPFDRRSTIERILDDHRALLRRAAGWRVPEFLALDVTMSQAKVLHILSVVPEASMSALANTLGVSLPTMSGLVDRLAEHGLVGRHGNPADRRHVLVSLTERGRQVTDAFYEVGRRQLRTLLRDLEDDDLAGLRRGVHALAAAAERHASRLPDPVSRIAPDPSRPPDHERTSA
jgi:DNA-binding MarR family transcriptional regulator